MRQEFLLAILIIAVVAVTGARAQQQVPPQAPAATPAAPSGDLLGLLSGMWNRFDLAGSGSYMEIKFPEPLLTPEYAAKIPVDDNSWSGVGTPPPGFVPPVYDIKAEAKPAPPRCAVGGGGLGGPGGIDVNSAGMSLVATKDLVLMLRDGQQGGRHIYMDGRPFPARLNGLYSIGRWESDALVVTTRGFSPAMVGNDRPTGRGYRDTTTEVTEEFRPAADGKRMTVTYTHVDPKIYVKPWVYQLSYERLPADQYVFESWCDSREWIAANPAPPVTR